MIAIDGDTFYNLAHARTWVFDSRWDKNDEFIQGFLIIHWVGISDPEEIYIDVYNDWDAAHADSERKTNELVRNGWVNLNNEVEDTELEDKKAADLAESAALKWANNELRMERIEADIKRAKAEARIR